MSFHSKFGFITDPHLLDPRITALETSITSNVIGPTSSTENAVPKFDDTNGKIVKDSGVTISDTNVVTASGVQVNGNLSAWGTVNADTIVSAPTVSCNTINEQTADAGITAENVILKDGNVTLPTASSLKTQVVQAPVDATGLHLRSMDGGNRFVITDTANASYQPIAVDQINPQTGGGNITFTSGTLHNGNISVNQINERDANVGITIDDILLKDGTISKNGLLSVRGQNTTIGATADGQGIVAIDGAGLNLVSSSNAGRVEIEGGLAGSNCTGNGGDVWLTGGTALNAASSGGSILLTGGTGPVGNGNVEVAAGTQLLVSDTTASTATNNGALQVLGGIGVGESVVVGNYLATNSIVERTAGSGVSFGVGSHVVINDTTAGSTSTMTGALTVAGGAGIAGNVAAGTIQTLKAATATAANVNKIYHGMGTTPSMVAAFGPAMGTWNKVAFSNYATGCHLIGTTYNLGAFQTLQLGYASAGANVNISNGDVSTDTTTGALTVNGGVGIAGALNVGGNITATGTVSAANPINDAHLVTKAYADQSVAVVATPTWYNGVTATAGTLTYSVVKNVVTFNIRAKTHTFTSSTNDLLFGSIPVAMRSSRSVTFPVIMTINGANAVGECRMLGSYFTFRHVNGGVFNSGSVSGLPYDFTGTYVIE